MSAKLRILERCFAYIYRGGKGGCDLRRRGREYYSADLEIFWNLIVESGTEREEEKEEEEKKTNRNQETRTSSWSGNTHSLLNSLDDSHFDVTSRTFALIGFTARGLLRVVNWTWLNRGFERMRLFGQGDLSAF